MWTFNITLNTTRTEYYPQLQPPARSWNENMKAINDFIEAFTINLQPQETITSITVDILAL